MIYADISLDPGAKLELPADHSERAIYVIDGAITLGADRLEVRHLAVIAKGARPIVQADGPTRLVLLGGEPLEGPRYIWWNFVSSSQERIRDAAEKWRAGRFTKVFDDSVEFTPAPSS
jgi:redox-sensitive bicupin YhaK (pirin superfamily)